MDSSGSLRNEYHKEKEFLKILAASFNISPDGGRAGVVTFSSRAEHSIKMSDHTDIASFDAAVDAIPLMGFQTRIDRALRLAQVGILLMEMRESVVIIFSVVRSPIFLMVFSFSFFVCVFFSI